MSSTKAMHGHFLGAAGALEFVAAVLALERQLIPSTINLRLPDPACDLDYVADTALRRQSVCSDVEFVRIWWHQCRAYLPRREALVLFGALASANAQLAQAIAISHATRE